MSDTPGSKPGEPQAATTDGQRIKELANEAAANRVRATTAEREAESLRAQLRIANAEHAAEVARKEAEDLRQKLAAVTDPTDEELIARGNESQSYFDRNREKIDGALRRQADAARKAEAERILAWNNRHGGRGGTARS